MDTCTTEDASDDSCSSSSSTSHPAYTQRPSRVLFGSCNSQDYPQPLWPAMESRDATAFVWGGDAIYADRNIGLDFSSLWPPHMIVEGATPEELRNIYQQQNSHEGYRSFLDHGVSLLTGCWDDHDYGTNNGDSTYPHKQGSAEAFVHFLGEPDDSIMMWRAKQGHGAYGVKLLDFNRPLGHEVVSDGEAKLDPDLGRNEDVSNHLGIADRTVAIFVLDVRTHKTPWYTGPDKYRVNPEGDFLGERQWQWFEKAIARSRASVNIVVQGLQVHAMRYPDGNVAEEWAKFPVSRQRLYNALLQDGVRAPFLVSGDVHHAQLLRKDCQRTDSVSGVTRSLMEVTTSGMTHSWGTNFCSRPSSKMCQVPYAKFVLKSFARFAHWISPWTELVVEAAGNGLERKMFSLELNYAEFEFDWSRQEVLLRVLGKDKEAGPLFHSRWSIEELSGDSRIPGGKVSADEYAAESRQLQDQGATSNLWACVNYRGVPPSMHYQVALAASLALPMTLMSLPLFAAVVLLLLMALRLVRYARHGRARGM